MDIFNRSNQLMLGNLVREIKQYDTFLFVKSAFTANLYNFICPISDIAAFDWATAEKIMREQEKMNFQFSFYVQHNSNYADFQKVLTDKGYQVVLEDTYLLTSVNQKYEDNLGKFILVDETAFPEFLKISAICFPEWDTNDEFCQILFTAQQEEKSSRADNYLIKKENNVVGVCSHLYSKTLNLSYQTNVGTLPDFRGKGIQKRAIKYLSNQAWGKGITNIYTIVEPDSISYANYQKVGFQKAVGYDIFSS